MNKIVDFEGIGYVAATFPVNETTKAYLKANHTNPSTGNVDINGKKLAVKMAANGEVGFGASSPAAADALLGIIVAYEMDGFASVQIKGGVDGVPTKAAIASGAQALVVNDKGQVEVLSAGGINTKPVVKPSVSNKLVASIIL